MSGKQFFLVLALVLVLVSVMIPVVSAAELSLDKESSSTSTAAPGKYCIDLVCDPSSSTVNDLSCSCKSYGLLPYFKSATK